MKLFFTLYLTSLFTAINYSQVNREIIQTKDAISESKDVIPTRYHAIIIAESDYSDSSIIDLESNPIEDANNLAKVLIQKYSFINSNIAVIINGSRNEIIDKLELKRRELTEDDNFSLS